MTEVTAFKAESPAREAWRMFRRNIPAVAGVIMLSGIVLATLWGTFFYGGDPFEIVWAPHEPPGVTPEFPLGTDYLGRDIFAGSDRGRRPDAGGGGGGGPDHHGDRRHPGCAGGLLRRLGRQPADAHHRILPGAADAAVRDGAGHAVLALAATIALAIGVVSWPQTARLTRAEFMKIKELEYVTAARAIGARNRRIIWTVILPNAAPPLIVSATLTIGVAILFEAGLSFLGLGDPNTMSWGLMIGIEPRLYPRRLVARDLSRSCDLSDRLLRQPDRRRAERRLQSEAEGKMSALLQIEDLRVTFNTRHGPVTALDSVSLSVNAGETLGVVGESGCGKSITALSVMGLIPSPPGKIAGGAIRLAGEDLTRATEARMRALRGAEMAMIFQEPMTSLNPVFTVGDQIAEAIMLHQKVSADQAFRDAVALLDRVGIPSPDRRARDYPHQLSGGMRQRVMIAMAVSCRPKVLIADEPTTALDVTVQAQIFDLLNEIQRDFGAAIILITHDMGAIAEMADRVAVMYAGRVIEQGLCR